MCGVRCCLQFCMNFAKDQCNHSKLNVENEVAIRFNCFHQKPPVIHVNLLRRSGRVSHKYYVEVFASSPHSAFYCYFHLFMCELSACTPSSIDWHQRIKLQTGMKFNNLVCSIRSNNSSVYINDLRRLFYSINDFFSLKINLVLPPSNSVQHVYFICKCTVSSRRSME